MDITVERSKSGLPTTTERGGGSTSTGWAVIIAGTNGEKVKPLFVPRGYSNGDHAVFVIKTGMYVVHGGHDRGGEKITAYRVNGIATDDSLILENVGEWENGDGNIPGFLDDAVQACKIKMYDYHCRSAHYAEIPA